MHIGYFDFIKKGISNKILSKMSIIKYLNNIEIVKKIPIICKTRISYQHSRRYSTLGKSSQPTVGPVSLESELKMYYLDWIYPRMRNPTRLWFFASVWTVAAVGLFAKLILVFLNKTKVHNMKRLIQIATRRPKGVPLVTVSNHYSCFDDPGIWGLLPFKDSLKYRSIRWSLAAHDICFTTRFHSLFFMWGKCIPVIRGGGVYQPALDLCIQKLTNGDWVHVFPEGRVNMSKEFIRLKWGVGRIIYESPVVPIILPVWHEGMDSVLHNEPPYILRIGKKVTMNVGEPIDLNDFIMDLKNRNVPEPEARKLITDKIQDQMQILRQETEILHQKYLNS